MLIPQGVEKRAPTPTQNSQLATETFVNSSSVASAVTKLNHIIESLRKQNKSQAASLGATIAFMVIFLVLLLVGTTVVTFRFLNRKRASKGIDYIPGTQWAMFALGPSLNTAASRGLNGLNSSKSSRRVTNGHIKEMAQTQPDPKLENPYASLSTFNTGQFPKKFISVESDSPSTTSNDTFVEVGNGISRSKEDMLNAERYPDHFDHHGDKSTINDSMDSSPNVNRYTIDIEFDPYKQPQDAIVHDYDQHNHDQYNGLYNHDQYNQNYPATHDIHNDYNNTMTTTTTDSELKNHNVNPYVQNSHNRIVSEMSAVGISRKPSDKRPIDLEEYDDFEIAPNHHFLAVEGFTSPHSHTGQDNRVSVVSSVYDNRKSGYPKTPDFEKPKYY